MSTPGSTRGLDRGPDRVEHRVEEDRPDVPPLRRDGRVLAWIVSRGLSEAGDRAWLVALAWTAVHVAGPAHAGLLLGVGTLPRAALLLVGGALAGRWGTNRTVALTNLVRVLVMAGGIVALSTTRSDAATFWVLAAVALLFGAADALHNPAASTMARQMVRPDDLRPLMAVFQTVTRIATLTGAPLGGLLVALGDVRVVMAVNAVSFVGIGLVYALLLRPRFPRARADGVSWRAGLREGLVYVRRTPDVRTLLVALSGLNLFVGPALAVGLALRVSQEHWGAHTLGLLEACVGAGAVVGAVVAARWDPRRPALVGFGVLIVQGVAIALFGVGGPLFLAMAAGLIGVTSGSGSTYLSALFQLTVDVRYLGRTASFTSLADDALMPAAMAGFGALAAGASLTIACVVFGAAMSLTCLWSMRRLGV